MRNKRFPNYPDDSDYTTNAPSYYDDLARKQKLIELLAKKIWEYEETLDLTLEQIITRLESYIQENDNLMNDRLEQWDLNLEKFPENVELLLQEWLSDGTLDHIINDTIFNATKKEIANVSMSLEETKNKVEGIDKAIGGTYLTLTELETEFPNGDSKRHVVAENNHWYFWNGSEWESGGVFQGVGIPKYSEKLSILKDEYLDKNEFRKDHENTLLSSGFSGTTGTIVNVSGNLITNFIKMDNGDTLTCLINGISIFNGDVLNYANNKIAVYNANLEWEITTNAKNMNSYTATDTVFLRIQTNINAEIYISTGRPLLKPEAVNLKNSQDFTIFKPEFLTKDNLFDTQDEDFLSGKGFSGTTGTIVNSASNFISGYIELNAGDVLTCLIDGISIFDDTVLNYTNNKIAVYDSSLNWIRTAMTKDMNSYTATTKEYVRIMGLISANNIVVNTSSQGYILSKEYLEIEETEKSKNNKVDLAIFMGQSNMAGRGIKRLGLESTVDAFPIVPSGQAYEFKAISNPTMLSPISEPFGYYENSNVDGEINDSSGKTGSMISAFVIDYYKITKTPLVCVSASQGATGIDEWQPETPKLNDAINRFNIAKNWLLNNGYEIGNIFMVWCQGEADFQMDVEEYKTKFDLMVSEMVKNGIEKCFNVRIGEHNSGDGTNYDSIIQAQTELCKVNENIVLVGTKFAEMRLQGLMKDTSHYYQEGYNIQGSQAGINVANYLKLLKEPMIYDSKYNALYYSNKL